MPTKNIIKVGVAALCALACSTTAKADCCCIEVVSCVSMLATLAPEVEQTIQDVKQQDEDTLGQSYLDLSYQVFLANKRREELAVNIERMKVIRMYSARLAKEQAALVRDIFPSQMRGIEMLEAEAGLLESRIANYDYTTRAFRGIETEIEKFGVTK